MDEQYISMCDTPEIQDQWKPDSGSRSIVRDRDKLAFGIPGYFEYRSNYIWLPLQENIQEMLLEATGVPWEWFSLVEAMVMWAGNRKHRIYASMNLDELWLCYYMRECHKKTWSKTGWVICK